MTKNTIKCDQKYLPFDELEGFVQQTSIPGRLAPFFRPGIWFYERSNHGRDNGLKRFMRNTLGTKPIIYDPAAANHTLINLNQYLQNKGFYHADITFKADTGRRTVKVTYQIKAGRPCLVSNFTYHIDDPLMRDFILSDTSNGKLHSGMIYDTYVLGDERDRIAGLLRNRGYYTFSLADVFYYADTADNQHQASVELNLRRMRVKLDDYPDSIAQRPHPRFYIRNVYISSGEDRIVPSSLHLDTLYYRPTNKSKSGTYPYYILHSGKLAFKPGFLASQIQFLTGDIFSQQAANLTYKKLIGNPAIRNAAISMNQAPAVADSLLKPLDCNIKITSNKAMSLSFGTEGTNSAGKLGIGLNTLLQHRNIFRGAEVFSLKLKGSAEFQAKSQELNTEKLFLLFNTLESGIEAGIEFPRILAPAKWLPERDMKQAGTSLNGGLGFEFRPEYVRNISTLSWNYNWQINEYLRQTFTPLELNFVNIGKLSSEFQTYLQSLSDAQYKALFSSHMLTIMRYTLVRSNITQSKETRQYYFRFNNETSGNIGYLADKWSGRQPTSEGYYERFGIRYSQFFRSEIDYRRYWKRAAGGVVAARVNLGIAVPYGNSEVVPFEKSFWLGGANDMRGWKLRSLGPGEYQAPAKTFDQSGNLLFQASIEQRFPLYSFLLGSLFADAGNIWLIQASEDFPGGEIKASRLAKQIAVDAGLGLRFDFTFFIFRVDIAMPLHDPANTGAWLHRSDIRLSNLTWNFGIGYPF